VSRPVAEIIDQARQAPAPRTGALLATSLTAGLLWLAFYPFDFGPLAWLAPVPYLLLARIQQPTRWMYRCVYLAGAMYWVPTLQWMRLGDPAMIPAWLALAFYLALYFPVGLAVMRAAVHRLNVPLAVAAPIVWVGLEYLRSHLMTGFAWYLLGHSQHDFTTLIQISDLFGAYGVSFVVLFAAAALAECVPGVWFSRLRLCPPVCDLAAAVRTASARRQFLGVLCSALLVGSGVLYGVYRQQHAEFPIGPRVALIQGDFRSEVKHDPDAAKEIYQRHFQLTGLTVEHRPDVIIWPETMFPYTLLSADSALAREELLSQFPETNPAAWTDPRADVGTALRDRAEQAGATMIVGVVAQVAAKTGPARYNSAVFVKPQAGITGRYDKMHRVPFGEYIPLLDWLPFLAAASPYSSASGIQAGDQVHVFELGQHRLVPLICFEDTVPHLVRTMVNTAAQGENEAIENVDCLVNLTNDGWFRDSSEQEQHLITASFRCIETRTPMVRAVNTGISAVIDGDGVVCEPLAFIDYDRHPMHERDPNVRPRDSLRDPRTGRYHKSLNAALVADIPLDPRGSLYLWWGDCFAAGCLLLTVLAAAGAPLRRVTSDLLTST
jgi:apolipoprotein N-acyltransferase